MELYRMGENAIRIRLNSEDLEAYGMTFEELDYDTPQGKRMIHALFEQVKDEAGFDTAGEKIYIQLYPTRPGGCELFITKLEKEEKRSVCFCFSDFDALFEAVSRTKLPAESDLWQEKKNGCFYVLTTEGVAPALFFEFGEKIPPPSHIYLRSRCRRVRREERPPNG